MFVVVSRRRISGGYKVRGREGRRNIWRGRNTIILNTTAARGEAIAAGGGGGKGRITGKEGEVRGIRRKSEGKEVFDRAEMMKVRERATGRGEVKGVRAWGLGRRKQGIWERALVK